MIIRLVLACICLWVIYVAKDLYSSCRTKAEKISLVTLYATAIISIIADTLYNYAH